MVSRLWPQIVWRAPEERVQPKERDTSEEIAAEFQGSEAGDGVEQKRETDATNSCRPEATSSPAQDWREGDVTEEDGAGGQEMPAATASLGGQRRQMVAASGWCRAHDPLGESLHSPRNAYSRPPKSKR